MSEFEKPWGDNVFDWYLNECDKEITVRISEHNYLSIMEALGSLYETMCEGEYEITKERIYLLGELIASTAFEDGERIIQETIVKLGMESIDEELEHFLEHHAEEYKEE